MSGNKYGRDSRPSSSFYKDYNAPSHHGVARHNSQSTGSYLGKKDYGGGGSSSSSKPFYNSYEDKYATTSTSSTHHSQSHHHHNSSSSSYYPSYSSTTSASHHHDSAPHRHHRDYYESSEMSLKYKGGNGSSSSSNVLRKKYPSPPSSTLRNLRPPESYSNSSNNGRIYEKSVRRVPPPLSPPHRKPLMSMVTSSPSRFRQAPPRFTQLKKSRSALEIPRSRGIVKPLKPLMRKDPISYSSKFTSVRKFSDKKRDDEKTERSVAKKKQVEETKDKTKDKSSSKRTLETANGSESDATLPSPKKEKRVEVSVVIEEEIVEGEDGEFHHVTPAPLTPTRDSNVQKITEKLEIVEKIEKISASADTHEKKKEKVNKDKETDNNEEIKLEKKPNVLLKIKCIYCNYFCVNYRDFGLHLRSYHHTQALNEEIRSYRKMVDKLRESAKEAQKELEKSIDAQKTLSDTTSYCKICEIDLRTDPKEHEETSEIHNEIKSKTILKCEACDMDFRMWKVYMYHAASLDHVKKVAIKELEEKEAKGEAVKGTNLTIEEIGVELLEPMEVLYCKACIRYLPIFKEDPEESRMKHCLTHSHVKYVQEYRTRMIYIAKRDKEEAERKLRREKEKEEARLLAEEEERKKKLEEEKKENEKKEKEHGTEQSEIQIIEIDDDAEKVSTKESTSEESSNKTKETDTESKDDKNDEIEKQNLAIDEEEIDADEIQLHADLDDSVDAPVDD